MIGLVLAWLSLSKHLFSAYWLFLAVALYALLAILHEKVLRRVGDSQTATAFYRRGMARMEDHWAGTGESGERFRDAKHPYSEDLDLFGKGCLFELLSTARLPMGENTLAEWLRFPSPIPVVLIRQQLIAELRESLDLRETLALIGSELRVRLNPESLTQWTEGEAALSSRPIRVLIAALSAAAVAGLIFYLTTLNYVPLLIVIVIETLIFWRLQKHAERIVSGISANADGLILFSQILKRIEEEPFRIRAAPAVYCGVEIGRFRVVAGNSQARPSRFLDRRARQRDRQISRRHHALHDSNSLCGGCVAKAVGRQNARVVPGRGGNGSAALARELLLRASERPFS